MWTRLLLSLSLATTGAAQLFDGLPVIVAARDQAGAGGARSCGANRTSERLPLMSDLRRRVLGDHSLDKRLTASDCGLTYYCPTFDVCCNTIGYSCCTRNTCCAPGYACTSSGCIKDVVVTTSRYTTTWYTYRSTSIYYTTSTSTYWTTTTDFRTVTTTSQNGVATSTIYVTSTKFEKRDNLPRQTDVKRQPQPVAAPAPTGPAVRMVGSAPRSDMLGRALAHFGIIEKRLTTVTIDFTFTSTTTSYSYSTSYVYRYLTSTTGTTLERTSTVFNGASTTLTVTSTYTTTFKTGGGEQPPPPKTTDTTTSVVSVISTVTLPPPTGTASVVPTSSTSGSVVFITYTTTIPAAEGLSTSAQIGIGVGVSAGALVLLSALAAFFLIRRRRRSAAGGSDRATIFTTTSGAGGGAGAAAGMTESRTMSPATVSAAYPSGMTWADGKDARELATPSPLGTSPTGSSGGFFVPWPAPPPSQPGPQPYAAAAPADSRGYYQGQSELSAVHHSYGPAELAPQSLQELAVHQQHQQHHGSIPYAPAPVEVPGSVTPAPPQSVYRPVPVRYGHQQQGSGDW